MQEQDALYPAHNLSQGHRHGGMALTGKAAGLLAVTLAGVHGAVDLIPPFTIPSGGAVSGLGAAAAAAVLSVLRAGEAAEHAPRVSP